MPSAASMFAPAQMTRHDHTLVTLVLRLASSDYARDWILYNEDVFASIFAILRPRVIFPSALEEAIENLTDETGKVSINSMAFEQWRKSEQTPFAGDVSVTYMEAFFLGMKLHRSIIREPDLWISALSDMALAHGDVQVDHVDLPRLDDVQARLPEKSQALFHMNIELLNILTQWSSTQKLIVELAFLLTHDMGLRLFFDLAQRRRRHWTSMLEAMLELSEESVWDLTSPSGALSKSGIVTVDPSTRRVFPMGEFWHQWFSTCFPTIGSMFAKMVRPLTKRANAGALGRVHPDDRAILLDLFQRSDESLGRNVLLYGPRSIDKLGLVKDMLDSAKLDSFTLHPDIPDRDLASVAFIAQAYVAQTCPSGVLVIPSADAVLTRTRRGVKSFAFFELEMDDEVSDTEGDEALLSHNLAKTIWLVNSTDRLSEDNLGRFLYVAPVKPASRAERRMEIETILAPADVRPEFHQELSQHLRLSEQQLRSAVRLVETLSESPDDHSWVPLGLEHGSVEYREALMRRVIEQSQRAMDRRDREHLRQPITTYSLDFLNLAGHFSVEQIIHSLKRRPSSSLCFYGLPGTGKTQLAEYIAIQLDRPIVMKRASDLINKYIGESEKAIQKMFQEAAEEDAVLFLDEADSFLMDRSRATHSWETSQVNELLQCMERFRGVFICATNLFERVDRAAMRRFTFKLEFLDLNEDQRWRMLCNEAAIDPTAVDPSTIEAWKNELMFTPLLTPGDFATVQRQCQLLGQKLTPEQWLHALGQEAKIKKDLLNQQRAQQGRDGQMVMIG